MSKFWTAFAARNSCTNWKGGAELHHRCGEQLQKSEEIELRKNGARCDERLSEGKKRGKNRLQARAAVFKGFSMGTCQKLHSDEQHWQYPKRFIKEMNAGFAHLLGLVSPILKHQSKKYQVLNRTWFKWKRAGDFKKNIARGTTDPGVDCLDQ